MSEDEKPKVPPFEPDYNLIEKLPRDWSGFLLMLCFFGMVIFVLVMV